MATPSTITWSETPKEFITHGRKGRHRHESRDHDGHQDGASIDGDKRGCSAAKTLAWADVA